jgi:predicted nucleic acid-binding protein
LPFIIDTNIAVHLRDGDEAVTARLLRLDQPILMSVVSRVELEGGVYRDPVQMVRRRARLDTMLATIPALAFDAAAADIYGRIVSIAGYSRQRLLDRMIAAQAIQHRATLITRDKAGFLGLPDLSVEVW